MSEIKNTIIEIQVAITMLSCIYGLCLFILVNCLIDLKEKVLRVQRSVYRNDVTDKKEKPINIILKRNPYGDCPICKQLIYYNKDKYRCHTCGQPLSWRIGDD